MADRLIHLSVGLLMGTLLFLPSVFRRWSSGRLASAIARLLVASFVMGVFAVIPNILRFLGCPDGFCSGWWMNIFLFHSLLDRVRPGGLLVGGVLVVVCFALQYGLLLLAIVHVRRRQFCG